MYVMLHNDFLRSVLFISYCSDIVFRRAQLMRHLADRNSTYLIKTVMKR